MTVRAQRADRHPGRGRGRLGAWFEFVERGLAEVSEQELSADCIDLSTMLRSRTLLATGIGDSAGRP